MKLQDLEAFYSTVELPEEPIRLNQSAIIESPKMFVESHLNVLRANSGNERMIPYFDRLVELHKILNER